MAAAIPFSLSTKYITTLEEAKDYIVKAHTISPKNSVCLTVYAGIHCDRKQQTIICKFHVHEDNLDTLVVDEKEFFFNGSVNISTAWEIVSKILNSNN